VERDAARGREHSARERVGEVLAGGDERRVDALPAEVPIVDGPSRLIAIRATEALDPAGSSLERVLVLRADGGGAARDRDAALAHIGGGALDPARAVGLGATVPEEEDALVAASRDRRRDERVGEVVPR